MQLILGWPPESTFGRDLAMKVMNLCADLMHRNMLGEVVAALPPSHSPADRARLFALATSLRHAGAPPLALLGRIGSLAATDLDECLGAGISNFIFVDDAPSPLDAIAVLSASRLAETQHARVRLWLDDNCIGNFQRHLTAWISAFPFAVEAAFAPFVATPSAPAPGAAPSHEQATPARCEWLRSIVTITGSGSVIPCPAHASSGMDISLERLPEIQATRTVWMQSLGGSAQCRGCAREARFRISRWSKPIVAASHPAAAEPTYRDYIECDAADLSQPELAGLVDEFTARIIASANGTEVQ